MSLFATKPVEQILAEANAEGHATVRMHLG